MVFHHGVTFGLVTSIMTNCHTFVNSKNKRTKIKHLDSASSKRNQDETSLEFLPNIIIEKGLYTPIHVYSCITLNHFELPILGPLSRTDSAAQRETGALQALQKARNLEFDRNFTSISNFNKNCNHFY